MNKDHDRHLIQNLLSKGTIRKAPQNLSDRVWSSMNQVTQKVSIYRPLIPTWVWVIVGAVVLGVLFMVGNSPEIESSGLSAYLQSVTIYLDQRLQNLTLIAFSSLTLLVMVIYFNSILVNAYFKKLYD